MTTSPTPTIEGTRPQRGRRNTDGGAETADTYSVERKIEIEAPAAEVYERIADFRCWRAWSPYEKLDPSMDRKYSGAPSGAGAVYEWAGSFKAGAGQMEIVNADPNERVVIEQRNHKPFKSESTTTFALEESGSGTTVTWSINGPKSRVIRVMGIVKSMDQLVGPLFEAGLRRLKADAEAR